VVGSRPLTITLVAGPDAASMQEPVLRPPRWSHCCLHCVRLLITMNCLLTCTGGYLSAEGQLTVCCPLRKRVLYIHCRQANRPCP
jgi:hypothetical protein